MAVRAAGCRAGIHSGFDGVRGREDDRALPDNAVVSMKVKADLKM